MAKTTRSNARTTTKARTRKGDGRTRRPTKGAKRGSGAAGRPTVTLRQKGQPNDASKFGGMRMPTLTPQLVVGDADGAIAWYTKVFGAKELDRKPLPNGKIMHAVLRIGDTGFMISDSFGPAPDELNGAFIHIQDKGIEAFWSRATANGATTILPLANQFWGDKYGQLRDPFGQVWSFGWPAKMTQAEKDRLQQESLAQMTATPPATR